MLCDIINAEYIEGYKLKVVFENNKQGVVDFSSYIGKGGVFDKFIDIDFFLTVHIAFGINEYV